MELYIPVSKCYQHENGKDNLFCYNPEGVGFYLNKEEAAEVAFRKYGKRSEVLTIQVGVFTPSVVLLERDHP